MRITVCAKLLKLFCLLLMAWCVQCEKKSASLPKLPGEFAVLGLEEVFMREGRVYMVRDENLFTGQLVDHFTNGQTRIVATFVAGRPDGLANCWRADGRKRFECLYAQGEMVSKQQWGRASEKIQSADLVGYLIEERLAERGFRDDGSGAVAKRHGAFRCFSADGSREFESSFVGGASEGPRRIWHANGQVALDFNMKDGAPVGEFGMWNDQGDPIALEPREPDDERLIEESSEILHE